MARSSFLRTFFCRGFRLPLQPAVQKILAQIGVAKSKSANHGGWVQANCLKASKRGHFVSVVPTSQKSWRNQRVLLSGDWESPSGTLVRFHDPTTFQIAGRSPARRSAVTDARRSAEAKRMNESFKRRLMMGLKEKKKKWQLEAVLVPATEVDLEDQTLADRLRQLSAEPVPNRAAEADSTPRLGQATEAAASKAAGKRPVTVDLDAKPMSKCGRQTEASRAIFAVEDEDGPAMPINIACPLKTVQFVNDMILGSQMELSEIEEIPKRLIREEAGRAFCLQASAFMDIWLCMRRAITAAERAKKAYEDGRAKVAEAGKALQDHAHLLKDKQAVEWQVKASEAKLEEMRAALDPMVTAAKMPRRKKGLCRWS
ncbi:unnamed protein product [Prunus armeniaca]